MSVPPPVAILRLKDVVARIKLSRSFIYSKMAAGDFPASIALGRRAVGWLESDVASWIRGRALSSRKDGSSTLAHSPNTTRAPQSARR
jgi:prophage regulatory protein